VGGGTSCLTCHTTIKIELACSENCPLCYVNHQTLGIFAFLTTQKPLILDVQEVHLKVGPEFLLLATNFLKISDIVNHKYAQCCIKSALNV
jgi:hypothetical protein